MPSLQVKLDIDPVLRSLDRLGVQLAEKAITRSLKRTINSVKVDASRKVRGELNLKAKRVNQALAVRRVHKGALQAELAIRSQPVPLSRYGARQTARGVSVKIKRQGGRKVLRGTFLAMTKSEHVGVFARRGAARLPIGGPKRRQDQFYSTSVAQFLDDERVLSQIGEAAQEKFTKELSSQVDFLLR